MKAKDSRERERLANAIARKLLRVAEHHPIILNELQCAAHLAVRTVQQGPIDLHASADEVPESITQVLSRRRKAWTVAELAELLSLSERSIYDQIKNGSLNAVRIATILRICPTEVFNWYAQRVTNPS